MSISALLCEAKAVGALTSKPYAFTARSWELRSTNSIDISDGLFSRIRVDHRGGKVMRVLPRYSEEVNTDWISDKARHYLDALQTKRIGVPIHNFTSSSSSSSISNYYSSELNGEKIFDFPSKDLSEKQLKLSFKLTWNEILNQLLPYFLHKTKRGWNLKFWSGENTDNEGILALKEFANLLGTSNYESKAADLSSDLLQPFVLSGIGKKIDQMDLALFVGLNLRFESPVLNARVRRLLRSPKGSRTVVGMIGGLHTNSTYNTVNLGGMNRIVQLIEGQNTFCNLLIRAKNPLVLVSQSMLKRADGKHLFQALRDLNSFIPGLDVKVLSAYSSTVGSQVLNLINSGKNTQTNNRPLRLNYFVGYNPSHASNLSSGGVSIYQGSHFDAENLHRGTGEEKEQHQFDFLLPTLTSTEKDATYYSMQGELENASFIAFPSSGQSRTDWSIFQFLTLGFSYYRDVFDHFRKKTLEENKSTDLLQTYQFDDAQKYKVKSNNESTPINEFIQSWNTTLHGNKKRKQYLREKIIGMELNEEKGVSVAPQLSVKFSSKELRVPGHIKLYNSPNLPLHKDFYLTDEISRSSRLMTLCSTSYSNLQRNFA